MNILSRTKNGQISYCPHHGKVHFEFGNMYLNMSKKELMGFSNYVSAIDHKHFLEINKNALSIRKLRLVVGSNRIFLSLNEDEFLELRELLEMKNKRKHNKETNIIIHQLNYN